MDPWKVQKAVVFLVNRMSQEVLTKPVIIHGIHVGFQLEKWQSDETVILGGYLHDVLEDTETSFEELEKEFGKEVALIVEANTLTKEERGNGQRGIESIIEKCLKIGEKAVMVKAADILDNSLNFRDYFPEEKWGREQESLKIKRNIFLEKCSQYSDRIFYKDIESIHL